MPSDLQELETAFSRQGFTDGYFRGQTGSDMFGRRQEGEDTADLFASARATYEQGETQRIGVRFYAMIHRGQPARLAVEDRTAISAGPTAPCRNRPSTAHSQRRIWNSS